MNIIKTLTIIGSTIMCTSSIPAYAGDAESDFVYLDCDLYRTGKDEQSSYAFKIYYRFSESKNDIEVYQTNYNLYRTQCDITECSITDTDLNIKYIGKNNYMSRNINRQTGSYFENIIEETSNNKRSAIITTGSCKKGVSKITKNKKF